jgi:hypothetical protein
VSFSGAKTVSYNEESFRANLRTCEQTQGPRSGAFDL